MSLDVAAGTGSGMAETAERGDLHRDLGNANLVFRSVLGPPTPNSS